VPGEDERGVHELIQEQAKRRPNECAVTDGYRKLTYGDLNQRANGIAHALRELGVGLETPVAVCLERSPDLVAVLLGVLKAGGAYVPIDPASPRARIGAMIQDAGATVLITRESLAPGLPQTDVRVVWIEHMGEPHSDQPEVEVQPKTLAYIIYTSGSTGTPKGVEVEHHALRNLVDWHQRAHAVTAQDRATQVVSISFDAAGWEIWPYLAAGASVYIADDETRAEPDRLLAWLARQRITICFLPTPMAEAVLGRPLPAGLVLRALLTGGDRLRYRPPEGLPFQFTNHYGPTENTVVATFGPVTPDERNPAIGHPIDNNKVYILDPNGQPVPVWVPGEIYIGGASLARGYRNQPDLTASRFVPNPFDEGGATRLYRTGDLARFRPDGSVEFLGRIDRQVKVRGFRIEPGEVEAVLCGCPGIAQAVVMAREDTPTGKQLTAYYVRREGDPAPDIRQYLEERLPGYMVPSAFMELEALPVTANGKVDERALPKPVHVESIADRGEPRNAVEEVLAGIWAAVLNLDAVGVHGHFFKDYGGHSLLSVSLVARIREALQIDLPLRAIFEAPTVRGLADRLLSDPAEARHVQKVAELFLRLIDMPQEGAEGLLSGSAAGGG
jgi:amino acid adenylation domain-containing protein